MDRTRRGPLSRPRWASDPQQLRDDVTRLQADHARETMAEINHPLGFYDALTSGDRVWLEAHGWSTEDVPWVPGPRWAPWLKDRAWDVLEVAAVVCVAGLMVALILWVPR